MLLLPRINAPVAPKYRGNVAFSLRVVRRENAKFYSQIAYFRENRNIFSFKMHYQIQENGEPPFQLKSAQNQWFSLQKNTFSKKKLPQKRNQRLLERYFAKRCFSCRRESQCVFKSTLGPSKRTHLKTLNYKNSDRPVHTARKNE